MLIVLLLVCLDFNLDGSMKRRNTEFPFSLESGLNGWMIGCRQTDTDGQTDGFKSKENRNITEGKEKNSNVLVGQVYTLFIMGYVTAQSYSSSCSKVIIILCIIHL